MVIVLYIGVGEFLSENGFEDICIPEDVEKKIVGFAMTFLILNLLLQLGVVVDSCWGWARLRRRMVTLVPWKTNTSSLQWSDFRKKVGNPTKCPILVRIWWDF